MNTNLRQTKKGSLSNTNLEMNLHNLQQIRPLKMLENDTQTRVPDILAATLTFLPLAIFTVALRLWVRTRMVNALGWDDTLMVFALVRTLRISSNTQMLIVLPS